FYNHASIIPIKEASTTQRYNLSLHDALPISPAQSRERFTTEGSGFYSGWLRSSRASVLSRRGSVRVFRLFDQGRSCSKPPETTRSEEHTSELQSRGHLVCRLLLEKKKIITSI